METAVIYYYQAGIDSYAKSGDGYIPQTQVTLWMQSKSI